MNPVESARTHLPYDPVPPIGHVEVSYSTRSWPRASLERDQLEVLADLIASRVQQAPRGGAPDERAQLLTARQAAELLGVDLKTVYRHAKELGGRKVGGTWRFDLNAGSLDTRVGSSARYAIERAEPSKRPAVRRRDRASQGTTGAAHRQLLPVGRASDRDAAA